MSLSLALTLLLQVGGNASQTMADEILVVAKSRKCDLSVAGRTLRSPQFKARAAEWAAGRPVRVIVPIDARTRCLAKIMFRLHDNGLTRAEFVAESIDAPATMDGSAKR
jgi:hypothetical protein